MSFNPTPQQQSVLDWVDDPTGGSAIVTAVAGAGKTTTLVEAVKRMHGRVAVVAFNKSIAEELKKRMPVREDITIGTSHSFGIRALNGALGQSELNNFKAGNLAEDVLNIPRSEKNCVVDLVSLAKQYAMGVDGGLEKTPMAMLSLARQFGVEFPENKNPQIYLSYALRLLDMTVKFHKEMDFDDMIYKPLALGLKFTQFDWILVDEAQDLNVAQRIMITWMLADGGRVLAVGDPRQAIYGFRGADSDSFRRIAETFSAKDLPLTITFRCPKLVVKEAQRYVSHIEAGETAPDGLVKRVTAEEVEDMVKPGDAVLCRFSRPIAVLAFKLIRKGIPAKLAGRSIGMQLVKLIDRWKSAKSFAQLRVRLEAYVEAEFKKAKKQRSPALAEKAADMAGTLFDMMEAMDGSTVLNVRDTYGLKEWIKSNYSDDLEGSRFVVLSTIHKSKGLEWNNVFFYGSEERSPFAEQDWELEQEANLKYVAITRSQKNLYLLPQCPRKEDSSGAVERFLERARAVPAEQVAQMFDYGVGDDDSDDFEVHND